MRRTLLLLIAVTALIAVPATAATKTHTYKGQATSVDPDFKYGKVTIKRKGARVAYVEIKAVTATCSGQALLRTIVYRHGSKEMKVLSGGSAIRGGKMKVKYLPEKTVEDAETTIQMTFNGSKVKGKFKEEGLCSDEGLFKAKR